jgi:hypothetical protein
MIEGQIHKIVRVDTKVFYASVEQRDNQALQGKPVAVGHGASLALIRWVYPPPKGILLVGVTRSNSAAVTEPPVLKQAEGALI